MPIAVSHSTERLGIVGMAVALLSWLVVLGLVLVVSAVTGAELTRRPEDSQPEQACTPAEGGR